MTLEQISYIGQAVAAVAVLFSLAAVYGQLRQTNKIARAELTHSVWLSAGEMQHSLYDTSEKADLMHRALFAPDSLSAAERLRMESVLGIALGLHEAAFTLRQRELIEVSTYNSMESVTRRYMATPIVQQWWARSRSAGRDPAYVALLDAMIAEHTQNPPPPPTAASVRSS